MDGVGLPYIPLGLWLLTGAMTILILLVAFGFYIYWRRWAVDLTETGSGVASLAARKLVLEKDVESLREWIEVHKDELDRVKSEREEQERLRAVLSDLEQQCAIKNQENQVLRNEVGELENQRHHTAQTLERMQREIGDLEAKRAEAMALESRLTELRSRLDEAQGMIRNLADVEIKLNSLSNEKSSLERKLEDLRSVAESARIETDRYKVEAEQVRIECDKAANELANFRQQKAELEIVINAYNQEQNTLKLSVENLEQRVRELRALVQSAFEESQQHVNEARQKMAEAERASCDLQLLQIDRQRIETELVELNLRKLSLEGVIQDLHSTAELARAEVGRFKEEAEQARNISSMLTTEINMLRKEKAASESCIATLRQNYQSAERNAETMTKQIEELKATSQEAQKNNEIHIQRAKQAKVEADRTERYLSELQKDKQRVEMELGGLNAHKALLQIEIAQLEGGLRSRPEEEKASLVSYSDLLEKEPLCLRKKTFTEKREEQDESMLLQQVKRVLQQEGLVFHSRIIDGFHTSLKCHDINPITVLAGVSGTGKTLLPVRYAEIIGMHKLVMAVQPRWDSPQDMFGFYNYLDKRYKATELSRALVRMDPYNYPENQFPMLNSTWSRDRLLLVLLDEMNLARTEYYFSEFLSRLELRRTVRGPSNRSEAEIELDTGPGERLRLWVGKNVFFVGTMNEDETTQTLSDKVLDRANVLRFGKPDENAKSGRNGNDKIAAASERYLSFGQWRKWQREVNAGAEWYDQVSQWSVRLNAALNRVGRPFGFRVLHAIEHYVANYPRVDDSDRYKLAFADQVEQKIIPKIRGIDLSTDNANECLSEVEAIIAELGDDDLSAAFAAARMESKIVSMFQWRGVTRRMEEKVTRHAH
jgi:predicted  nucleic acid-binding Zn-ribbon protein